MDNQIIQTNKTKKARWLFYLIQFILSFKLIFCEDYKWCQNIINLSDKTCFNDVITFDHDKWRAGHACTNKEGNVIVEFSLNPGESEKRLFYGLNKKGRYYFPGEPVFREIKEINCVDCDDNKYRGRFESRNLLVHLKSDTNRQKEYLFSLSSYYSLVELIDIDDRENLSYYSWNISKFFGLTRPIFSYEFSLFEIENTNTYILAFIESAGFKSDNKEFSDHNNMIKFQIDSFAPTGHRQILNILNLTNTYDGRAVSAFRFDESNVIALLFVEKKSDTEGRYKINFYDDDFKLGNSYTIYEQVKNLWVGYGIFVKGISIKDDYGALAFYHNGGNNEKSLMFRFVKYNPSNSDGFDYIYTKNFDTYFRQDIQSNGLFKLEDNRVVLFTTEDYSSNGVTTTYATLHMFLFDFYNEYTGIKVREYVLYYPNKRFAKEMDASMYNGYILFTATISDHSQNNTFAIMMIFGFANGTDHEIDISPYLMDTGYYNPSANDINNNLYSYLINNMSIDNNIFAYEKIEQIRLIKICDELLLYRGKYGESKGAPILPNELFNGDHILLQNRDIKKQENKLYSLEYQFMVKEPDYDTFYDMPDKVFNNPENYDGSNYYTEHTLDGRVNILWFKLCHRFCIDCIEFGPPDNDQRCVNCKEPYTYDYFNYVKNYTGNCIQKDYLFDAESKEIKKCTDTRYKYFYNKTDNNKRYCFKYDYKCPDDLPYLNTTTNECIDFTPIMTTIPTIIPTTVLTTIPKIAPTTNIIPPTTIITPPTTIITPPTTVIIPPTTVTIPPTTVIIPPTTVITPPTTVIIPPTTIITPPTTIITPPTTVIVPQTTVITTLPKIITTVPIVEPQTTIPEIIPSTVIQDKCKYGILINYTSSFSNLTNQEIYDITKESIVTSYCLNGSSVLIEGSNGYAFQVTTTYNEIKSRDNGDKSSLDLAKCEDILREVYGINNTLSLIIVKFLKNDGNSDSKTFQYDIYHPLTHEKLNLSYCQNTTVDVYVPFVPLSEEIYNDLVEQGYDPLDLNDKFYREICTPYTSENGTDVLLDDREEFVYSSLVNVSLCPEGCDYTEYVSNKKYIKCECGTNNSDIITLDLENLNEENVYGSFLSTMKSTNYKVMRCYNLVFNFKIFCHNYGSIITLILFCVYIGFIIYYSIREISPIKVGVSKILFEEEQVIKNIKETNSVKHSSNKAKSKFKPKTKSEISEHKKKVKNPPKKGKIRRAKMTKNSNNNKNAKNNINVLNTENYALEDTPKQSKVKFKEENTLMTKNSDQKLIFDDVKSAKVGSTKNKKIDINKSKIINDELNKNLDDFELNNLDYIEACELDKRTFIKTYWSILKREHLALVTFVAWNDYNLFYVKINKFFVLFCTDMTMNGLFFVHESMHRKYTNGEDFTFVQKLPQILFTLIVSHVLDVLLCYLSMTDVHVYEIKALPKENNKNKNKENNGEKIMKILDLIKRKLVAFFVITFLLFLFYWYFISAFCAVYQNTQVIFLRDSFITFLTALIDPFFIYAFTTLLRYISLCLCCRKNCCGGFVYKLSNIIPIF